ncbi:MAG: carbohydrate kinase family protein [Chloroflexota bacterium]
MGEHILVIGAILLDVKGKPVAGLEPGTSNTSRIRVTRGGTARNVAENLGRLGADVKLMSAVGDDQTGKRLIAQTAEANVDVQYVQIIEGKNTGAYMAVLETDGSLSVAMDDVSVLEAITPGYLNQHRALFRDADMVMMDGSLSSQAMNTIVRLCNQYDVRLIADPSSTRLAERLRPFLNDIFLIVPNEKEAAALCQFDVLQNDPDSMLHLARMLVQEGVDNVIVTLSDFGIDYATSNESGYIPPNYSEMVDSTGTGDAATAAIMYGLCNEMQPIEAIRLGAAAAGLTLQSSETAVPDLSLDMLYEHLIV